MSMALTYTAISARSTFRNTRFIIFTLALPLVMYLLFNGLYGNQDSGVGLSVASYLMVSMAAYGAIGATINAGARIAIERQTGWNRQLRLSALTPRAYMLSRALVSLLVALPAILLVFLAGVVVGKVRLPALTWVEAGLSIWVALIPFAVLGLVIGFVATIDSVQPLTMVIYMAMSILGGLWFPVNQLSSFLQGVAKALPSYWVGEAGRDALAGSAFPMRGVLTLVGWTVGLAVLGATAYRRSGSKG